MHKILFLLLAFFGLASCSSFQKVPNVNEAFEKKYGQQVAKMNVDRTLPKEAEKVVTNFSAPSPEEVRKENELNDPSYYAYVDVNKFSGLPQNYTPNREIYERSRTKSGGLPDDIFEITYNTTLHPPFQRIGAEFDAIDVPPYDAHGVKTAMSDKTYLLAGGDALQRSVDNMEKQRTEDDVEISTILIDEQKQLKKKQRMEKIFGKNSYVELASLKSSEGEEIMKKPQKNSSAPQNEALGTIKN
jgi:hypothetical protein